MIRGLLMYSGHIWGFVAAFWGAFGLWSGNGLALVVAIVAALVSANCFNHRDAVRGARKHLEDE